MENPTLVVLTDRNDLDDQLFGQFARCHELLRQTPVQSDSREELQKNHVPPPPPADQLSTTPPEATLA